MANFLSFKPTLSQSTAIRLLILRKPLCGYGPLLSHEVSGKSNIVVLEDSFKNTTDNSGRLWNV